MTGFKMTYCKDCKYCRDRDKIGKYEASRDCFNMNVCDPIGGKDYWVKREDD